MQNETHHGTASHMSLDVYVIHYSPLTERRKYLALSLPKKFNAEWITEKVVKQEDFVVRDFFADNNILGVPLWRISEDLGINSRSRVKPRIISRIEGWAYRMIWKLNPTKENLVFGAMPSLRRLPNPIVEVTHMHIHALEKSKGSAKDWVLILEDDAILCESFEKIVEEISKSKFKDPVWVNLNAGAGLLRTRFDPKVNHLGLFQVRPPTTRCATAYMMNRKYVEAALDKFTKFGVPNFLPIDVIMQVINRSIGAKSFWSDPSVVLQGSEDGTYESQLGKYRF